jgi:hypothetical protein
MTPKERAEYEKQKKKKGPSKWKAKMLQLMGFPPQKIKEMTATVVTAQDESKIMQWLEQHAEDVSKATPEQLLKAMQKDLGSDVAEEAAELLKEGAAKNEETTGHQGEKGEGGDECKEWCESYYDRPCNCEEDKYDDRYEKYYASAPAWFTARKKSVYHTGEADHSAEVWHLDGLHYIYLNASGETVQYIIKVEDETQAKAYADEWVAAGSVRPKEHQSFVVAQHPKRRRRRPRPRPLPSGPAKVKGPMPRPKAPPRDEEEMVDERKPPKAPPLPSGPMKVKSPSPRPKAPSRYDEEMMLEEEEPRRPPKPPTLPSGPVRVKSPPPRPRMPLRATADTIQYEEYGPGKFDDNVQEALYEYVLEGGADESLGEADTFGAYDLLLLGDDPLVVRHEDGSEEVIRAAILLTTNEGFVYVNKYDNESDARVDWEQVEGDYDEWLGEYGEEEY